MNQPRSYGKQHRDPCLCSFAEVGQKRKHRDGKQLDLQTIPCGDPESAAVAQVIVRLVEPILTGRIENIQVNRVFERPGFVWHV